jgi:hypothetical protein
MSMEADLPEIPEDKVLYSKQYYGIGEVASMFKVNTSYYAIGNLNLIFLNQGKTVKAIDSSS